MKTLTREQQNKNNFCRYMEDAYRKNKLLILPNVYILDDENCPVLMDIETGLYINTEAGKNKSNKRQYINIDGFMCPAYTFRVVFEGLTSSDPEHKRRYLLYRDGVYQYRVYTRQEALERGFNPKEKVIGPIFETSVINHKNGDTMDNSDSNLEVVTVKLNNIHASFMGEVAYHHPELIETELDCQEHRMHRWLDGVGLSCNQLENYNKQYNDILKPRKNKKGQFNSYLSRGEVDHVLEYFGKLNNKEVAIC